jgi:hypothetical protein
MRRYDRVRRIAAERHADRGAGRFARAQCSVSIAVGIPVSGWTAKDLEAAYKLPSAGCATGRPAAFLLGKVATSSLETTHNSFP